MQAYPRGYIMYTLVRHLVHASAVLICVLQVVTAHPSPNALDNLRCRILISTHEYPTGRAKGMKPGGELLPHRDGMLDGTD